MANITYGSVVLTNCIFAVIHKERMNDVIIKQLTADFISKSSQRKGYFRGVYYVYML
jgi:hypothetical protein